MSYQWLRVKVVDQLAQTVHNHHLLLVPKEDDGGRESERERERERERGCMRQGWGKDKIL